MRKTKGNVSFDKREEILRTHRKREKKNPRDSYFFTCVSLCASVLIDEQISLFSKYLFGGS